MRVDVPSFQRSDVASMMDSAPPASPPWASQATCRATRDPGGRLGLAALCLVSGMLAASAVGAQTVFPIPATEILGKKTNPSVADFNSDGLPDVVVLSDAGGVKVLFGRALEPLATGGSFATATDPSGTVAGDFNADGKADVATANFGSHSISILLGHGDGTFANHVDYVIGGGPYRLGGGDFDGNGTFDLAVTRSL